MNDQSPVIVIFEFVKAGNANYQSEVRMSILLQVAAKRRQRGYIEFTVKSLPGKLPENI